MSNLEEMTRASLERMAGHVAPYYWGLLQSCLQSVPDVTHESGTDIHDV